MHCSVSCAVQLQHIVYSMLCFVFCTAHSAAFSMLCSVFQTAYIAAHCIFPASFYILHCLYFIIIIIYSYFALLTLQYTAYFMIYSVFYTAHIASHCIFQAFSKLQIPCFVLLKADSEQKAMHTTYCSTQNLHFSFTQYLSECLVHHLE